MAINIATPNIDDLKHHSVFGSSVDQTTDLYTNDIINVPGGWTTTTVRIHGGSDTVYGRDSDDIIYDNRAINGRPLVAPDGSTYIPAGSGSSGNDSDFRRRRQGYDICRRWPELLRRRCRDRHRRLLTRERRRECRPGYR